MSTSMRDPLPHDRATVLASVLANPPVVHPMDRSDTPALGVWSTDEDAYQLLARRVGPGTRTLETGCGLSTVLFAALGADHICCTPGDEERNRIVRHCVDNDIPTDRLDFRLDSSHVTLPPLLAAGLEVDVFLLDGGHGFPMPIIDWFYGASMLVPGGLLVVDDVNLPAVHALVRFLDRDPRWPRVARTSKWAAYERTSEAVMVEDWFAQPFYKNPTDVVRREVTRWSRRAVRVSRRAAGRVGIGRR